MIIDIVPGFSLGGMEKYIQSHVLLSSENRALVVITRATSCDDFLSVPDSVPLFILRNNASAMSLYQLIVNQCISSDTPESLHIHAWNYRSLFFAYRLKAKLFCSPSPIDRIYITWKIRCDLPRLHSESLKTVLISRMALVSARIFGVSLVEYNSYRSQRSHKKWFNPAKTMVCRNLIDMEKYTPPTLEARVRSRLHYGLSQNALVLGMAARLHKVKDHRLCIESAMIANIPNLVLVFCGRGVTLDNLSLHTGLNLDNVDWIYCLDVVTDMTVFYALLDIHILTSKQESCPNSVLESMSADIPNIATDVGDIRTIVGSSGICVSTRHPIDLAAAIEDLASSISSDCPLPSPRAQLQSVYS